MSFLARTLGLNSSAASTARLAAGASGGGAGIISAPRLFTTSAASRYPRRPPSKLTPRPPTDAQLSAPPPTSTATPRSSTTHPQPQRYTPATPIHIRKQLGTPRPQRHLTDTETAIPLPTTFPAGITSAAQLARPRIAPTTIPESERTPAHPYPYRYYEITLRRGLNGLSKHTKKHAQAVGLLRRHQVVWRAVGPRAAGHVLRLRELVDVKLVNEIPEKVPGVKGFVKVGSALPSAATL